MQLRHMTAALAFAALAVTGAAEAQSGLQIHGYLSQAYAKADGGQIFGVPESGTTDYGNAAVQFRYGFTSNDYVVLQLAHRRVGQSTLIVDQNDISVDWAFYGRRFGNGEVKIGRIAIPSGIYNEIRDAGILLPFYRAPFGFYLEGSFTSETVDGVVGSYYVDTGSPWSFEVSGFAGEYDVDDRIDAGSMYVTNTVRATGAMGANFWVNTSVPGVRVGGGASRYNTNNVTTVGGVWNEFHGSVDAQLERFTAQAEYRRIAFTDPAQGNYDGNYHTWYGYLGVRPIPQLTLSAMYDMAKLFVNDVSIAGMVMDLDLDWNKEISLGASYALSPSVVLKGEVHRATSFWADLPVLAPGLVTEGAEIDYVILSVAAAF